MSEICTDRPRAQIKGSAFRSERERESHLLNPPPGSTDPERFATVSIGIGEELAAVTH